MEKETKGSEPKWSNSNSDCNQLMFNILMSKTFKEFLVWWRQHILQIFSDIFRLDFENFVCSSQCRRITITFIKDLWGCYPVVSRFSSGSRSVRSVGWLLFRGFNYQTIHIWVHGMLYELRYLKSTSFLTNWVYILKGSTEYSRWVISKQNILKPHRRDGRRETSASSGDRGN
jgi:hypothetical protein